MPLPGSEMPGVLIIASAFHPAANIGARRPTKVAIGLRNKGWDVRVLTLPPSCFERLDAEWNAEAAAGLSVTRVACGSLWAHTSRWRNARGTGRLALQAGRAVAQALKPLCPVDDLYPWVARAAATGKRLVQDTNTRLIWATVPKYSALWLGDRIAQATGAKLIVDFRDVLDRNVPGGQVTLIPRMYEEERAIMARTDGFTYVARSQREAVIANYPVAAEKSSCFVPNWIDSSAVSDGNSRTFSSPTIVHGGSLYGGTRRLDGFVEALALVRSNPKFATLRFLSFGPEVDAAYLKSLAARYGLEDAVDVEAPVPADAFMEYCRGAAVLLLPIGRDSGVVSHAHAVPGKLFDYFAARRPILVTGPAGSEAGSITRDVRRGLEAGDDDPQSIATCIENLLSGQAEGHLDLSEEAVRKYGSEDVILRLDSFLRSRLAC